MDPGPVPAKAGISRDDKRGLSLKTHDRPDPTFDVRANASQNLISPHWPTCALDGTLPQWDSNVFSVEKNTMRKARRPQDGELVPSYAQRAILIVGSAAGVAAGGLFQQYAAPEFPRRLSLVTGSAIGAAIAGYILAELPVYDCVVSRRTRIRDAVVMLVAMFVVPVPLLAFEIYFLVEHGAGSPWTVEWIDATSSLTALGIWLVPKIGGLVDLLSEMGREHRAPLLAHLYAINWLVFLVLSAVFTSAPTEFWSNDTFADDRPLDRLKRLLLLPVAFAMLGGGIYFTLAHAEFSSSEHSRGLSNVGHRDDGSLLVQSFFFAFAGTFFWWLLAILAARVMIIFGPRSVNRPVRTSPPPHPHRAHLP